MEIEKERELIKLRSEIEYYKDRVKVLERQKEFFKEMYYINNKLRYEAIEYCIKFRESTPRLKELYDILVEENVGDSYEK